MQLACPICKTDMIQCDGGSLPCGAWFCSEGHGVKVPKTGCPMPSSECEARTYTALREAFQVSDRPNSPH